MLVNTLNSLFLFFIKKYFIHSCPEKKILYRTSKFSTFNGKNVLYLTFFTRNQSWA